MRTPALLLSLVLALVSLLTACEVEPEPPVPPPTLDDGLVVSLADGTLELRRGGATLLRFPAGSLQVGELSALNDNRSFDPAALDPSMETPLNELPVWRRATSMELAGDGGDPFLAESVELALAFEGGTRASLHIDHPGEDRWTLDLVPEPGGPPIGFVRLAPRVSSTEGFYGLGGVLDSPEHRGRTRAMQLEFDGSVESVNNEAHVAVPLLIGTTGWGLFVEDPHPSVFDVATQADDLVEVTVGTGMDTSAGLRFHLYTAEHPLDVTRRYYQTTGDPLLPARWGLGPVVWRDENEDQAQVLSDLQTMRDLDLAASGYWIDRPYASGVNSFDFSPDMFDDPEGMIAQAHALGYRMALWHTPYVDPEGAAELHDVAITEGYFPLDAPPLFNNWSLPIDLTNPEAYAWWQGLIRRYTDLGIEGFKLDYAEDFVLGLAGGRLRWSFFDGSDERTMHHRYQELYHRVYAETLPEDGGFLLCRTGMYGDQKNVSVIWPGDLDATLNRHGVEATDGDETYLATGGLPASLVDGLSLGPSGFPFYGSDTGGYRHAPPSKETFTRWFQQTALSTVMQIGTNANDVAWELGGANGFDEEMLGWYREFVRLHLRLFPTLWTYAKALEDDGRPIMRAYGLARPELGLHPADTYFLGDWLLVAPVLDAGATTRAIPLPPGRWIHWFTGEVLDGGDAGREVTVDAPLSSLPLLLAEGGIVPLLRPTIDTMSPTDDPGVDSYVSDAGLLWPRIFPGPATAMTLFDGAVIEGEDDGAVVRLQWADGDEFTQGAVVELLGMSAPASAMLDGQAMDEAAGLDEVVAAGGFWADGGSLWLRVPAGEHQVVVTR